MKVFLCEYICSGGFAALPTEQVAESLRCEGAAMMTALAFDLSEVAEVVVAVDPRLRPDLPSCQQQEVQGGRSVWSQWARAAQGCDAAIVIAPEVDGILAKAVGMLRAAGVNVIAASGDFLRVASDKRLTARALGGGGVPHPTTLLPNVPGTRKKLQQAEAFIVKPRDGAGTQEIQVYDDFEIAVQMADEDDLIQAYVRGTPASVAVIVSGNQLSVLPAVSQEICGENRSYLGGSGPLDDGQQRRAAALAQRALAAMPPSARGFIGLDLVLDEIGNHDVVIEINPRLTTSYVGLRHIVAGNLAARVLGLQHGPIQCQAEPQQIRWSRDGHVWSLDHQIA